MTACCHMTFVVVSYMTTIYSGGVLYDDILFAYLAYLWAKLVITIIQSTYIRSKLSKKHSMSAETSWLSIEFQVEKLCEYHFHQSEGELGIKSNLASCITALQLGYQCHQITQHRDFSRVVEKRDIFLDVWYKLSKRHQAILFACYGLIKQFPPMAYLTYPKCVPLAYMTEAAPPTVLETNRLAEKTKKTLADKEQISQMIREATQLKKEAVDAFYKIYQNNQRQQ